MFLVQNNVVDEKFSIVVYNHHMSVYASCEFVFLFSNLVDSALLFIKIEMFYIKKCQQFVDAAIKFEAILIDYVRHNICTSLKKLQSIL